MTNLRNREGARFAEMFMGFCPDYYVNESLLIARKGARHISTLNFRMYMSRYERGVKYPLYCVHLDIVKVIKFQIG